MRKILTAWIILFFLSQATSIWALHEAVLYTLPAWEGELSSSFIYLVKICSFRYTLLTEYFLMHSNKFFFLKVGTLRWLHVMMFQRNSSLGPTEAFLQWQSLQRAHAWFFTRYTIYDYFIIISIFPYYFLIYLMTRSKKRVFTGSQLSRL